MATNVRPDCLTTGNRYTNGPTDSSSVSPFGK